MNRILIFVPLLLASQGFAQERGPDVFGGWNAEIGAAAIVGPAFMGSDETEVRALPIINFTSPNERIFISTREGIGYKFIKDDVFEVGAALTYVPGRDTDDDNRIRGFEDIDAAAGAKLFGQYKLTRQVALNADITQQLGGADGLRATVGVGAFQPLTEKLVLTGGLETTWASKDDQAEWFGVTGAQSATSGLPAYSAKAGLRDVSLNVAANYAIDANWGITVGAGVSRLLGDAADSPVSAEDTGVSLLTGVTYKF